MSLYIDLFDAGMTDISFTLEPTEVINEDGYTSYAFDITTETAMTATVNVKSEYANQYVMKCLKVGPTMVSGGPMLIDFCSKNEIEFINLDQTNAITIEPILSAIDALSLHVHELTDFDSLIVNSDEICNVCSGSFVLGPSHTFSEGAFAQGVLSIASHMYSHAEGQSTVSDGYCSHSEGNQTRAIGSYAHAEGWNTQAVGAYAHSEGVDTISYSDVCHSEGYKTLTTDTYSHAEGAETNANGFASHAEGYKTITVNAFSHACGQLNKPIGEDDIFVIGNGEEQTILGAEESVANSLSIHRSNAFRVTLSGATYTTGAVNTSGADYAEFFEWQDGNPDGEDRVGRFVTLDGEFIRYANQGDYILGIVSGNPAVVGNSDEDYKHRWLRDDFGRFVREYVEPHYELIDTSNMLETEIEILRHHLDVEDRDGALYRKTEVATDHVTTSWHRKQSPDYNPDQPYTERKDRPEWDYVGMLGVLAVYDDGTCEVNSYCQCGENGIATKSSMAIAGQSFRVIKRISPNIVKVVFR